MTRDPHGYSSLFAGLLAAAALVGGLVVVWVGAWIWSVQHDDS